MKTRDELIAELHTNTILFPRPTWHSEEFERHRSKRIHEYVDDVLKALSEPERLVFIYTVYNKPSDYPDTYVVKRWIVGDNTVNPLQDITFVPIVDTNVMQIRMKLKQVGLTCIGRAKSDDPNILESWI